MQALKRDEELSVFDASCVLCRSNMRLIFPVDSSLAVFWVSLKFEERSEDTVSFPLTLNNIFTSCARWHKNSNWVNILSFHIYSKHGATFDLNRFICNILTAKTVVRLHPVTIVYFTKIWNLRLATIIMLHTSVLNNNTLTLLACVSQLTWLL